MIDDDKFIDDFLIKLNQFWAKETEDCIQCSKHVALLIKIGHCVYAQPCGCRLWQGKIPQAWEQKESKP